MRAKKFLFLLIIFATVVIYFSCEQGGVNPYSIAKGRIILSVKNLPTLNQNIDGMYAAWLRIDTPGMPLIYHLGYFNIDAGGNPVDSTGGAITFTYNGDTNILHLSTHCFVTVEPPDKTGYPSTAILLDDVLRQQDDSLLGDMTIGGPFALGQAGQDLMHANVPAHYMVMSQTSTNNACNPPGDGYKGLWLCDTAGNSLIPNLGVLPSNGGWMYEAWLADTLATGGPYYYSIGKFFNINSPIHPGGIYNAYWDNCRGPNPPEHDKIGQDWIGTGCFINPAAPQITTVADGHHQVFITIEPESERSNEPSYQKPFPFKIFRQTVISTTINCRVTTDNLFNTAVMGLYPSAHVNIKD